MARRHASPGRPHLSQDPMLLPIPLQRLSGGVTPIPEITQNFIQFAPTTRCVRLAQGVFYRGAGFALARRSS
jgi:ABC-2 type transport system permease protein